MPLTAKDIFEKTFKRSFKGYDEYEVDNFLDQIIDEFKALTEENESLKEEVAAAVDKVKKIKHGEETIMNTLVSAQKTAERIINEATLKAELIISSAQSTAKERADQTTKELAQSQNRLEELRTCAKGFAANFVNMINAQAAYFEKTYLSYFGQDSDPFGGINVEALERIDKDLAKSFGEMGAVIETETKGDVEPENTSDTEFANEPADIGYIQPQSAPGGEADGEDKFSQPADVDTGGYMEFNEINKALTEIENADFSDEQKEETQQPPQSEADFSWIYDADKAPEASVADDSKKENELKTLIDEILE